MTGAGSFFIDLAYAAAGPQRGGPAKSARSGLGDFLGSISGSAGAHVVPTGVFTTPPTKRLGFRPEEAGGVEASASRADR